MYNTNIKYLYQLLLDLYRRFYGFYVIWIEPTVKAKNYLYLVDVYFYWKQLS